jgi:hypothetical protein
MDFVEVIELEDGRIARHRVYWGWRGFKVLEQNNIGATKALLAASERCKFGCMRR